MARAGVSAASGGALIYGDATTLNDIADEEDLRPRFDVLTQDEAAGGHRCWTSRDQAATRGFFRPVTEV